jgi:hypothetical protein
MKDKIKQAGFKTQKELASHLNTTPQRIGRLLKGDKLLFEYLDTRIENIALKKALKTFEHYVYQ